MGLGNKFKEVKKAYVEANKLLGDLIKVSTEQAASKAGKGDVSPIPPPAGLVGEQHYFDCSIPFCFFCFVFHQFPGFPAFVIYQQSLCNYLTLLCILFMALACCFRLHLSCIFDSSPPVGSLDTPSLFQFTPPLSSFYPPPLPGISDKRTK